MRGLGNKFRQKQIILDFQNLLCLNKNFSLEFNLFKNFESIDSNLISNHIFNQGTLLCSFMQRPTKHILISFKAFALQKRTDLLLSSPK